MLHPWALHYMDNYCLCKGNSPWTQESSILARHQIPAGLNAPVLFHTQLRLWPEAENCCICNIKVYKQAKYKILDIHNISLDAPHAHENTCVYQLALNNYKTRCRICPWYAIYKSLKKNVYFSVTGIHNVSFQTSHFIFMNTSGARLHKISTIIFCQNHKIIKQPNSPAASRDGIY